jgi:hypothetical protein
LARYNTGIQEYIYRSNTVENTGSEEREKGKEEKERGKRR